MSNIIKSISVVWLLGVLGMGSAGSYAYTAGCPDNSAFPLNGCTLPGVVDGSFPYVNSTVTAIYNGKKLAKKGYFDIGAKGIKNATATLFDDTGAAYTVDNAKFSLRARVDEGGAFGSLMLSGVIDGSKFSVTANLNPGGKKDKASRGDWNVSEDSTLWGFNTYDIVCKGLESLFACTQNEVVFLNLLNPIGPDTGFVKSTTAGSAITSVPVPAAAWLFGSGLLGLIAVSRRSGRAG